MTVSAARGPQVPRAPLALAAVVLTGGTGLRLGGVEKDSIELDGITLLDRALAATAAATEVVVVGDQVATSRPVTWTRESPVGGGPAAGVLAGLDTLGTRPDLVCVLAEEMPRVTSSTVARLVDAALVADVDAAVLATADGVRQTLAGVYRYDALVSARPTEHEREHGLPMRTLIAPLRVMEVAAAGDEGRDVDTWEDLRGLGG